MTPGTGAERAARPGSEHAAGRVPVLMYHSIGPGSAGSFRRFVVDPGEFAAQMDYLDVEGYRPVTASAFTRYRLSGAPPPQRTVVLTFDDGFTDFVSAALPVLAAHRFPATLFVPTGYVGSTARFLRACGEGHRTVLSWPELRGLAAEGIEIASHSHTHPQLDRVPSAVIRDEVQRSRRLLEDNLGLPVAGFGYPFGYWNRTARAALAAAGFRYGCAVAELATVPGDDILTLPRLTVNAGIGVTGLAALLGDGTGTGGRQVAAAKRIAWRAMRRCLRRLGGDPREGWLE